MYRVPVSTYVAIVDACSSLDQLSRPASVNALQVEILGGGLCSDVRPAKLRDDRGDVRPLRRMGAVQRQESVDHALHPSSRK